MNIFIALIAIILIFLSGALFGVFGLMYPLMRHPHLHMYYKDGELVKESMLIPLKGLRDMNGNEIKTGDLVMMLANGNLLIINRGKPLKPQDEMEELNNTTS